MSLVCINRQSNSHSDTAKSRSPIGVTRQTNKLKSQFLIKEIETHFLLILCKKC